MLWDRQSLAPGGPGDRLAGPPHRGALPSAPGRWARADAPGADRAGGGPLLLRHQAGVAAPRSGAPAPGGAGRTRRRDDGHLAHRQAHRWPAARHRSHQRLPHPAVRPGVPATGTTELLTLFGIPRALLPGIVPSSAVWSGESDAGVPGPESAHRRHRRRPAGGAVRPGVRRSRAWAKNTYGTGAFLLTFTGQEIPRSRRTVCWSRRRRARGASRPTRWKGASSSPGPRCSGSGTGSGWSARRPRPRRWPGVSPTPAGCTSCPPSWGSARPTGRARRAAPSWA